MTPDGLIAAWDEIAKQPNVPGPYLYLQVKSGALPIGAILRSSDRHPGLMIRVPNNSTQVPRAEYGRGFSVERAVPVGAGTIGVPIVLEDMSALGVFALICADIVSEAEKEGDGAAPIARVMRRIQLWRRFLSKRSALLSPEEQRGLFAEVHILSCVCRKEGVDLALAAWQGPKRELHDFRFSDGLLEVKSWATESGARIHISHPSQIVVDNFAPVQIAAVRLHIGGPNGITLPELVGCVKQTMDPVQAETFEELLSEYGYMESHSPYYSEKIDLGAVDIYDVREGFPHVDVKTIPGGISNLRYSIELGSIERFRSASAHLIQ